MLLWWRLITAVCKPQVSKQRRRFCQGGVCGKKISPWLEFYITHYKKGKTLTIGPLEGCREVCNVKSASWIPSNPNPPNPPWHCSRAPFMVNDLSVSHHATLSRNWKMTVKEQRNWKRRKSHGSNEPREEDVQGGIQNTKSDFNYEWHAASNFQTESVMQLQQGWRRRGQSEKLSQTMFVLGLTCRVAQLFRKQALTMI